MMMGIFDKQKKKKKKRKTEKEVWVGCLVSRYSVFQLSE